MAGVEISPDGRTATVNGQLVALENLPPAQQDEVRALAQAQSRNDGGMPIVAGFGGVPEPTQGTGGPQWAVPPAAAAPSEQTAAPSTPTAFAHAAPSAPAPRAPQGPRFATVTNKNTQTQGLANADKHMADAAKRAERERDLAVERARYQVEAANARAQAAGAEVLAREKAEADVRSIQQDGASDADAYRQRAEAKRAEATELQEQGHDFWEDKNTGHRIMAVIGLAAGGALAGMNGGPNQSMVQLNKMMAREDALYQKKTDGLRKDAEGEIGFYNIAKAATEDRVAQRLMVRDMQLDAVKAKALETQAQLEADSGASIGIDELMLAIDEKQAANAQALDDRITTTSQQRTIPIKPAGGGMATGPDGKAIKPIPGTNITDGGAYAGLSAEERKTARKLAGNAGSLYDALGKMARIREAVGSEAFDTKASTDYANLQQSAKVSLSQMLDQGTITAADAEQMKDLWEEDLSPRLSDVGRVVGNDSTLNKIRSAQGNVETQANGRLRGYGLKLEGLAAPNKRIAGMQGGHE